MQAVKSSPAFLQFVPSPPVLERSPLLWNQRHWPSDNRFRWEKHLGRRLRPRRRQNDNVFANDNDWVKPSPNTNINQSQPFPPQFPSFLMPPPQQQGRFIQQSQYSGSQPASPYDGYNSGQQMNEYPPDYRAEEEYSTARLTQSFRR